MDGVQLVLQLSLKVSASLLQLLPLLQTEDDHGRHHHADGHNGAERANQRHIATRVGRQPGRQDAPQLIVLGIDRPVGQYLTVRP